MPRALVTGANGFVGTALCRRLLAIGWDVLASVRTSDAATRLPERLESWVTGELGAQTEWAPALRGVHVVFHLAARVHMMREAERNPLAAFRQVNTLGTERLARAAAAAGVHRLVFVSSVKVNGEGWHHPYTEAESVAPEDPYAVSKWEAEQALSAVSAETGLETVCVRPTLVYGPGMKANMERLFRAIYRGIPLPLERINNRRSLLYVDNLVDFLLVCASNSNCVGRRYLLSDGEDLSTTELARRIGEGLRKPARLFYVPPPVLRSLARLTGRRAAIERLLGSLVVDSSRARAELKWLPPVSAAEGIERTAAWYLESVGRRNQTVAAGV